MSYQFHTTIPVRDPNDAVEHVWVTAELEWDSHTGSPKIMAFSCDDEDVMDFWNSAKAPSIEMAIVDDALRLHYAYTDLQ